LLGLHRATLRHRLRELGVAVEKTVTRPPTEAHDPPEPASQ
jgi:hypothetical protein